MQQLEFIKIYLPNEISEKMDIPIEIMDKLKTEIDNISYLIGPDGKERLVKFRRCDNEGFFIEGWRDFIKDNCVSSADLLLFRYEGNLRFNVNIFCPSGCESEHALTAKSRQGKGRFNESDGQPMFIKVFVPQYSSAHMLIPIDFVERNMKGEKNDYADLVVGSGEQWRVAVWALFSRRRAGFLIWGGDCFWQTMALNPLTSWSSYMLGRWCLM